MFTRKLNNFYKRSLKKYMSSLQLSKSENNFYSDIDAIKEREKLILENPDYFSVHDLFTVKDLFDARVHYGHKISSLNDKMKPFLFGSRLGYTIFDLNITAYHLREALNIVAHMAFRDGIILFVSKNPMTTLLVEKTAIESKEFAVTREWKTGIFSNSFSLFKCVTRLPDLCILLNTKLENGFDHPAVVESARACIPTIGIVDSNCNPNLITYPIPGNDDSYASVLLYCNLFKQAILRGKNERERLFPNEKRNFHPFADDNKVNEVQTSVLEPVEQIKAEAEVNVKSEARPEGVKSEAMPEEVKSEARPEVKPEARPEEVKSEAMPEVKSEARPEEIKSEVRAEEVKSQVREEKVKSEARAEVKSGVRAEVKSKDRADKVKSKFRADKVKSEVRVDKVKSEVSAEEVKSKENVAGDKKTVETEPIVHSDK